jgi:hypothetical protein
MVNGQGIVLGGLLADGTNSILLGEQPVVSLLGQPILLP